MRGDIHRSISASLKSDTKNNGLHWPVGINRVRSKLSSHGLRNGHRTCRGGVDTERGILRLMGTSSSLTLKMGAAFSFPFPVSRRELLVRPPTLVDVSTSTFMADDRRDGRGGSAAAVSRRMADGSSGAWIVFSERVETRCGRLDNPGEARALSRTGDIKGATTENHDGGSIVSVHVGCMILERTHLSTRKRLRRGPSGSGAVFGMLETGDAA